jgi:hypothetical protein
MMTLDSWTTWRLFTWPWRWCRHPRDQRRWEHCRELSDDAHVLTRYHVEHCGRCGATAMPYPPTFLEIPEDRREAARERFA